MLSPLLAQGVRPVGSVQSVEESGKKLTLKTDGGPELQVVSTDATKVLKIKPGQTNLTGATSLQLSEITAGDRILVQGTISPDQKTIPARQIIVMTKTEIAGKQASDLADWNRRGIFGVVSTIDTSTKTVVVNVRSGMPGQSESKPVTVKITDSTVVRRYAPDSVKFSEAVTTPFSEIQPGDQMRARGEKAADGSSITAEEVVSGLFHNIAATIVSVDPQSQTIKVTDLDSKKVVLVKVSPDSSLKKMQPMMAQMLATRLNSSAGVQPPQTPSTSVEAPQQQRAPSGAARVGGGPGGLFGPGGPGSGPPNGTPAGGQMFDRLPSFTLQELKPGEALIISAPAGKTMGEITATMIVAGVEPILTAPSRNRQSILGNWNVDMSGGGMGMQ